MTIEKINGGYKITDIVNNRLVHMIYHYYTKKECIRMFKKEFKK